MVKSLLSRFAPKPAKPPVEVPTVDINRAFAAKPAKSAGARLPEAANDMAAPSIDLTVWLHTDLDTLSNAWTKAKTNPAAAPVLRSAVHNLYGASGAYGGGALTRVSGSLQRLVKIDPLSTHADLIEMHIKACRASVSHGMVRDDAAAHAVCDALEDMVNKAVGQEHEPV